ncbi:DUF3077 domain-containing protein [Pseudomonas akapageensis]|uniref:DUF3077 domain-containing protein n=1 Tax=Pseudomonas akapageensis TaxID=2609961 RepID=UPI00140A58A9|nr:DUF3077 domain-containing protein [Pseudomonas akapageensis]
MITHIPVTEETGFLNIATAPDKLLAVRAGVTATNALQNASDMLATALDAMEALALDEVSFKSSHAMMACHVLESAKALVNAANHAMNCNFSAPS